MLSVSSLYRLLRVLKSGLSEQQYAALKVSSPYRPLRVLKHELRYQLWLTAAFFGLERAPAGIRAKEWAVTHFLAMPIEHRLKFGTVYKALDYFKKAQ